VSNANLAKDLKKKLNDNSHMISGYSANTLTVLYDGPYPMCRREIGIYRNLQPLQPDSIVCFTDISNMSVIPPTGIRVNSFWRDFRCKATMAN
jgi:hypothetical protein